MLVEVIEKCLNNLTEGMMAQLGFEGNVEVFTKALRK